MPELPEVETIRRGIAPYIIGQHITGVKVRQDKLRYLVPNRLAEFVPGRVVISVSRRGKYLLVNLDQGSLMIHFGMSGSLHVVTKGAQAQKHDHIDIEFAKIILRYRDPRRFGLVLPVDELEDEHLLQTLGPEPLSNDFDGDYLFMISHRRSIPVKGFIMDSKVVAGVGNIYASEALFLAGVRPDHVTTSLSCAQFRQLADAIKQVLKEAIKQGGTTLKDFTREDGRPGFFTQQLKVYGRHDQPCLRCGHRIQRQIIAQRASFFCTVCQK